MATQTITRNRLSISAAVQRASAGVILVVVVVWLGYNLIHAPAQFFTVGIQGLSNGALYALIALGYTLV